MLKEKWNAIIITVHLDTATRAPIYPGYKWSRTAHRDTGSNFPTRIYLKVNLEPLCLSSPHPICCPSKYCYSSSMSHYDTCFYSDSSHTSTLTEQEAEKGSWFLVGFGDLQWLEGRLLSLLREGLTTSKTALTKMSLLGNRKWENYEAIMSTDNRSMGMHTCSLQLHVTLTTVCLWGTINAISPWLNT